jgi:uncharacterized NAD(P)/FAD-binding protein YdhS
MSKELEALERLFTNATYPLVEKHAKQDYRKVKKALKDKEDKYLRAKKSLDEVIRHSNKTAEEHDKLIDEIRELKKDKNQQTIKALEEVRRIQLERFSVSHKKYQADFIKKIDNLIKKHKGEL